MWESSACHLACSLQYLPAVATANYPLEASVCHRPCGPRVNARGDVTMTFRDLPESPAFVYTSNSLASSSDSEPSALEWLQQAEFARYISLCKDSCTPQSRASSDPKTAPSHGWCCGCHSWADRACNSSCNQLTLVLVTEACVHETVYARISELHFQLVAGPAGGSGIHVGNLLVWPKEKEPSKICWLSHSKF